MRCTAYLIQLAQQQPMMISHRCLNRLEELCIRIVPNRPARNVDSIAKIQNVGPGPTPDQQFRGCRLRR